MTTGDEPSIGGDKRIDTSGAEPKLGGEAAILHLVEMLNHDNRGIRYRAALALAESGDDRAFDTLIAIIADWEDRNTCTGIVRVLGMLGDKRAVEPLIEVLNNYTNDSAASRFAAEALGNLGDKRAVEPLKNALRYAQHADCYPFLYWSCRSALKRIGTPEALAAIEDLPFRDLGDES